MKGSLLITYLVLLASSLSAQIKFKTLEYANGLKYPEAVFVNEPAIQDSVNKIIKQKIGALEQSDFCIGDFGYVQKGSHLQIHFMCNCIDMAETEHRYAFINLSTGTEVKFDDIFLEKDKSKALAVIQKKINGAGNGNEDPCAFVMSSLSGPTWDDLSLRLHKDGIQIRPANNNKCEHAVVFVSYNELTEYFKYQFN